MRRPVAVSAIALLAAAGVPLVGQQVSQAPPPAFRSAINLVLVDVSVRDKKGAAVSGLRSEDFQLFEDGRPQQILTFAYEEITGTAQPIERASMLAAAGAARADRGNVAPAGVTPQAPVPLTSENVAGRRLLTLLFDTSSMQPEDVQKAADAALRWVDGQMTAADLVAVASIGSSLQILTDFTSDRETVHGALQAFSAADGTAYAAVDAATTATDEAAGAQTSDATAADASAQELDTFNNDVRLRALKTLAEALAPIQQKKAILYFSAGMQRSGTDNQVELRAAVNAAVRANVAIYPVDARGLQAVVPGGRARQGSRGGLAAFTGSAVASQFSTLAAQQETLTTLASDTGGKAFLDSNDFGEAFGQVTKDISSYYILGYVSTNTEKDGRYRRISVRVRGRSELKVDGREGYYADRDFTHTAKGDREVQLQEQLSMQIPATDLPVFVTSGWFRLSTDRYYVPVSVAVPGSAVRPEGGLQAGAPDKITLDVAGIIRDERGFPVGRIRDTIAVPPSSAAGLAARQVLYQTGVTLPPGRFSVKVVVRENSTGLMGTFEARVAVPELKQAPVKVSSVVLGTQLQGAANRRTESPLIRNGLELVPNVTHIVGRDQKLYFYYEVYDAAQDSGAPQLRTSLAFYRGRVKVFETPVIERTQTDAADRRATIFQFEVPAGSFRPGLYTCQINIVDEVAGRFVFPRMEMYVR